MLSVPPSIPICQYFYWILTINTDKISKILKTGRIYGALRKKLKNTENGCKILKNGNIYTERQESSLEALCFAKGELEWGTWNFYTSLCCLPVINLWLVSSMSQSCTCMIMIDGATVDQSQWSNLWTRGIIRNQYWDLCMQCYDIANVIAMIEAMIWVEPIATSGWLLFPLGCGTVRGRHFHIWVCDSIPELSS